MEGIPQMSDPDLREFLEAESDRVEWKESPADGDRIREAICAFANDLPGYGLPGILLVGIDRAGKPAGLIVTDRVLQNLASMRSDGNILPFPSLDVKKVTVEGSEVAVVTVHPSDSPPVKFRGRIYVRSGPRRGIANQDDERRLNEKRRSGDLPFDVRPVSNATLDALDDFLFQRSYLPAAVAPEVLTQNDRSLEERYTAAKFAHPGSPPRPTNLGLLVVGKSPTDWIPGAYVQFLRIDGIELTDPIKNEKEIRGSLPYVLEESDDVLKANVESSPDFTKSSIEVRTPNYPIVAIQQIVRNAILHRTYEGTHAPVRLYWFNDRIEVQNPGGPFGHVTKDTFGLPGITDYRNPNLAVVMKDLGYVQRFGVGIALARKEMEKNRNPPPEFQVEDAFVGVILRSRT